MSKVQEQIFRSTNSAEVGETEEERKKRLKKERQKRYYETHQDQIKAYRRLPQSRERMRTHSKKWRQDHRKEDLEDRRKKYKETGAAKNKILQAALRHEIFQAYGTRCICCGENNELFLSLDHIENGRGNPAQRKGLGWNFYKWLKEHGFPKEGLQVLCIKCNAAKMWYGVCPHQKLKTPIEEYFEQRQRNETDLNLN